MEAVKSVPESGYVFRRGGLEQYKANPDHLQLIRTGVAEWNQWRIKHADVRPRFNGMCLMGVALGRVDLHGANLFRTNFCMANLGEADLSGANLNEAVCCRTNFRGADLSHSDLVGAFLYGADLRGADLRGARLFGAILNEADLRGALYDKDQLKWATYYRSKMEV